MKHFSWVIVWMLAFTGCARQKSAPPREPEAIKAKGLHNVFRLSEQLFSGSEPEGEAGFRSLQRLGVRTVLSVDGARPEVKRAKQFNLRYVHLPVGYDGISRERAWQLAKATRDLPGPVYIHCHHGMHRGPAAAAAVLLCLDPKWTIQQAEAWLKDAGTDPRYQGLIGLPRTLSRPSQEQLDALPPDYPETMVISDRARLMVEIDARFDHLKLAQKAGWTTPPDHPDINPAHEALLLAEHYQEASRLKNHAEGFRKRLMAAAEEASQLEGQLRPLKVGNRVDRQAAQLAFDRVRASCANCHQLFRDHPGRGK